MRTQSWLLKSYRAHNGLGRVRAWVCSWYDQKWGQVIGHGSLKRVSACVNARDWDGDSSSTHLCHLGYSNIPQSVLVGYTIMSSMEDWSKHRWSVMCDCLFPGMCHIKDNNLRHWTFFLFQYLFLVTRCMLQCCMGIRLDSAYPFESLRSLSHTMPTLPQWAALHVLAARCIVLKAFITLNVFTV